MLPQKLGLNTSMQHSFSNTLYIQTKYSRLSLSRNRRDPQKHVEISVFRHIRLVVLRKQSELPNFKNDYVIWLLKLEIFIENIVEKGRNCSPGAISPLFHIFCNLILDFCVKTRTRFSLRNKRLFEITEVEITRVDCIKQAYLRILFSPVCNCPHLHIYHVTAVWF